MKELQGGHLSVTAVGVRRWNVSSGEKREITGADWRHRRSDVCERLSLRWEFHGWNNSYHWCLRFKVANCIEL